MMKSRRRIQIWYLTRKNVAIAQLLWMQRPILPGKSSHGYAATVDTGRSGTCRWWCYWRRRRRGRDDCCRLIQFSGCLKYICRVRIGIGILMFYSEKLGSREDSWLSLSKIKMQTQLILWFDQSNDIIQHHTSFKRTHEEYHYYQLIPVELHYI